MNETTWQRVKEIFHDAVALSGGQRDEFVEEACGDDPAVLAEVRDLLASHDADEGLMKSPTFQGSEASDVGAASDSGLPGGALLEGPGTIVGRYKLLQEIGSGGFGVVYLAEQTEPVKRRVALKIIKLGMDTKQVIARFEAERQALAMMDHPNIARVLDAGATETGRPFFVMELVRGIPITEYCDKEHLNTQQRLDLFIKVCHAIQHAHQKGIIHRDIKPTNVLVTMHDDVPVPRVIDFGIAKATNAELTERTLFTEHGLMIGTPAYMSPEQAQMSDLDIDTRSDIYSLGVLLYELLTGTTPFSSKELREAGFGEIQRIIREEEPHKPSTRVSSMCARGEGFKGSRGQGAEARRDQGTKGPRGEGAGGSASAASLDPSVPQSLATDIAKQRCTDPTSLTRLLRGDLDWIVMKALEKNRTRRYETATGLAMDIQRHLDHEPVLAGPPSASYRLRKLARKHRPLVAGVAALFIVLLSSVVVIGAMYRRAEDARQLAIENQTLAEDRETEATEARDQLQVVVDFQSSMLSDIDAERMGRSIIDDLRDGIREVLESSETSPEDIETTLATFDGSIAGVNATNLALEMIDEHILARAVEAIERDFADQPLIRAALQQTIANTYLDIGLLPKARILQEAALSTRRQELGDEHPRTLQSINDMGVVLLMMGKPTEAEAHYREALAGTRRTSGRDHPNTLESLLNLSTLLKRQGKLDEAEVYLREVLAGYRKIQGDEHTDTLRAMVSMGALLDKQGKSTESLPYLREGLAGYRQSLGDDHPDTLVAINNLAGGLQSLGKYTEAELLYREALTTRQRVLGGDNRFTLTSMNNLGTLLMEMERFDLAEPLLREALERGGRVDGEGHPATLQTMLNLGHALRVLERLPEAETLFRNTIEGYRRVYGDDHPATLGALGSQGGLMSSMGKFAEAVAFNRQTLDGYRRAFGENHPRTLIAMANLGDGLTSLQEYTEAEHYLRASLQGFRRVLGDDHPYTLKALNLMGTLMRSMENYVEAEKYYRESLERSRRVSGDDHFTTLGATYQLGRVLRLMGRLDASEALGAEVVKKARSLPVGPDRLLLSALAEHGLTLTVMGRYAAAEKELWEAYEGFSVTRGAEDSVTVTLLESMIDLHTAWGKPEQAAQWRAKLPPDESTDTDDAESGG